VVKDAVTDALEAIDERERKGRKAVKCHCKWVASAVLPCCCRYCMGQLSTPYSSRNKADHLTQPKIGGITKNGEEEGESAWHQAMSKA